MTSRALLVHFARAPAALPTPDAPSPEVTRVPWLNRWMFERGGKRWRVAVVPLLIEGSSLGSVRGVTRRAVAAVDVRDWVESLGDEERWPTGTRFSIVVEEVEAQ